MFLGGVLTEYASWPWVFFINVPLAAVVLVLDAVGDAGRHDPTAARSTSPAPSPSPPASAAVVFAVVRAPQAGWTSASTLLVGAAGLALLGAVRGRSRPAAASR